MKHSIPECMMPDGAAPCQGYADLRKEFLALDSAARIAGDSHANQRADLEQRIEELEKLATQRGARMQIMREWMVRTDITDLAVTGIFLWVWDAFLDNVNTENWFDNDGVPR